MSVTYDQILHNVALRINALVGTQFAALETTYATSPLTAANFKSADWPFSSFRDAILAAESEFIWAIADAGNHPWRGQFSSVTAALADGDGLPIVDGAGVEIVGVYGAVRDESSGRPLTELPLEVVRRAVDETWRVYPLYYYKIDDRRIYHTCDAVVIGVCIYDRVTQLAAWNAAGVMLLPDALEAGVTARAISLMTRDGAYESQAAIYRDYSNQVLAAIRGGETNVAAKSLPAPTLVSTAA